MKITLNRHQGMIDPGPQIGAESVMVTGNGGGRYAVRYEELVITKRPLVSVVDDDESVRESLPDLLKEFGLSVQTFSSGEEFLASQYVSETACLILDVAMPGMSGPAVQQELLQRRKKIPIVFITAQECEAIRPQLLERGAAECLSKPFSDTALREAINAALGTK